MLEKLVKEGTLSFDEALKAQDAFFKKYEPVLIDKDAALGISRDEKYGFYICVIPTIKKLALSDLPDYESNVPVLLMEPLGEIIAF